MARPLGTNELTTRYTGETQGECLCFT